MGWSLVFGLGPKSLGRHLSGDSLPKGAPWGDSGRGFGSGEGGSKSFGGRQGGSITGPDEIVYRCLNRPLFYISNRMSNPPVFSSSSTGVPTKEGSGPSQRRQARQGSSQTADGRSEPTESLWSGVETEKEVCRKRDSDTRES